MTKQNEYSPAAVESVPVFGYELIRDVLLVDILGKDANEILYWAGKSLARKFPCSTIEELATFFNEAGWGTLTLEKESKREKHFELSGTVVHRRLMIQQEPAFTLESGFLAEQIGIQEKAASEAINDIQKRSNTVMIKVKWE
ncbi:MAG TPA: YslB family protein [Chondromyces sp.]|nr:YslB family protein [Chondromyces sp.]